MISLKQIKGFQWDKGNLHKSYQKHGITPNQAEEIFLDESLITIEDTKHSQKETRHIAIGQTQSLELLYAVFTLRGPLIRIISARFTNRKERKIYEKNT